MSILGVGDWVLGVGWSPQIGEINASYMYVMVEETPALAFCVPRSNVIR